MKIDETTARHLAHQIIYEGSGFTHPAPPRRGYMVGGIGYVYSTKWQTLSAGLERLLDAIKQRLANLIMQQAQRVHPPYYLGGWHDPETDLLWIEESAHYYTLDAALLTARRFAQKTIFNLKTQTVVDV